MFNEFKTPVVYIPGDNEWTDCHLINNGGYDNLERLGYLRKPWRWSTKASQAKSSSRTSA